MDRRVRIGWDNRCEERRISLTHPSSWLFLDVLLLEAPNTSSLFIIRAYRDMSEQDRKTLGQRRLSWRYFTHNLAKEKGTFSLLFGTAFALAQFDLRWGFKEKRERSSFLNPIGVPSFASIQDVATDRARLEKSGQNVSFPAVSK
jgi:hypothetical protein